MRSSISVASIEESRKRTSGTAVIEGFEELAQDDPSLVPRPPSRSFPYVPM